MVTDMVVMWSDHTRVIAMVITEIIHNPEVVGPVTAGMLSTWIAKVRATPVIGKQSTAVR